MKNAQSIKADKTAKELALVTAIIIQEDLLRGTLFQTFDMAFEIATAFVEKYGMDCEWGVVIEFDEAAINFAKDYIERRYTKIK